MPVALGGLVGLMAGFLLGFGLAAVPTAATTTVVGLFATLGGIFIDLIRMTMLPLVTTLLVSSLGALGGSRGLGRAGVRAVIGSALLLAGAITLSLVAAPPLLARVDIDRDAAIALRNASTPPAGGGPTTLPTLAQWMRGLVPPNIVRAAAEDVVLSVVVFAVLFGLALAKVEPAKRDPVLSVVEGIAAVMQRLVSKLLK
ncbi:MAG TPA: cation:dicarboxylase symporter family transporter, partial [Vicinamibacterales bacterium]